MNDGGMKLNCSVVTDILERVMITNALRSVKGFSFLKCLKLHMTSYTEKSEDDEDISNPIYPSLTKEVVKKVITPVDSEFDKKSVKKRKIVFREKKSDKTLVGSSDGAVRKFFKTF
jgi:hypothetical protein